jgi:hypothetical protein
MVGEEGILVGKEGIVVGEEGIVGLGEGDKIGAPAVESEWEQNIPCLLPSSR